ncbi:MAG: FtsW/RodA/SpoVE family cell cycle protein [Patescibacteria group bacterium]
MLRFSRFDRPFLIITGILIVFGFFIFASASLGYLAREQNLFSSVFVNQLVSLGISILALIVVTQIKPTFWNKNAFFIFLGAVIATLLVFVPMLGGEHGGAKRWIWLGFISFQPSELLKFGFIVYYAAWCAGVRDKIRTMRYGIVPLCILVAIAALILVFQPDFGTLIIITIGALSIFFASGASWKHIIGIVFAGLVGIMLAGTLVPYVKDRLMTFVDPSRDPLGAGYQIQQSLIAIGSGGITGRGFGQSVQKFNFLPEPIGDSIFAVFAEEWGFIGSIILISLFVAFLARGYRIANRAPTSFTKLLTIGFITTIVAQSFINIGAMLGIIPLTGDPLVFVSHGGSSLLIALIEIGIILRISSHSGNEKGALEKV